MKYNQLHNERIVPVTSDNDLPEAPEKEVNPINNENEKKDPQDYLDQLQRLQAEFKNYRNRTEKEWASVRTRSKADLVNRLLPVLDDFYRMIDHHTDEETIEINGVKLIYKNLLKVLSEEGLEEIQALGERFDPEFHEAVGVSETEENQDEMILEEWQKGYQFKGRLLRPSRVNVGRFVRKVGDE